MTALAPSSNRGVEPVETGVEPVPSSSPAAAAAGGLIFLEGIVSFAWMAAELVGLWSGGQRVSELKEEYHCVYDKDLGWANKPRTTVTDFYGPNRTITIIRPETSRRLHQCPLRSQ